jgi:ribosomal protein S18 acetylase RimI-like enzyme
VRFYRRARSELGEYGQERWHTEFDRGDYIVGEVDGKHFYLTSVTRESNAPAGECYLEYVWVAPDFRRRGVAFDVLTDIIGELKDSSVRTIFLWTLDGDNSARSLYERLDFTTAKRRQKLDADPERRWWEWLRRDLT